jgi:hypothetical protein
MGRRVVRRAGGMRQGTLGFVNRNTASAAWRVGKSLGRAFNKWRSAKGRSKGRPRRSSAATGGIRQYGNGGTISYFTKKGSRAKFGKKLGKFVGRHTYVRNEGGRLTCTAGSQGIATLADVYNQTDISGFSDTPATGLVFHKKCSVRTRFTNQDKGNVEITLYDIVSRRDMHEEEANNNYPNNVMAQGLDDMVGGGATSYTDLNVSPFDVQRFTTYFKVVKTTRFVMGAGQSHTHVSTIYLNKLLGQERVNHSYNYAGITYFTFMVINGMPYNDSVTKTQVSTGDCAVDWVVTKRYQYNIFEKSYPTYAYSATIPTSFTVAEDIMNECTGQPEVDADA